MLPEKDGGCGSSRPTVGRWLLFRLVLCQVATWATRLVTKQVIMFSQRHSEHAQPWTLLHCNSLTSGDLYFIVVCVVVVQPGEKKQPCVPGFLLPKWGWLQRKTVPQIPGCWIVLASKELHIYNILLSYQRNFLDFSVEIFLKGSGDGFLIQLREFLHSVLLSNRNTAGGVTTTPVCLHSGLH